MPAVVDITAAIVVPALVAVGSVVVTAARFPAVVGGTYCF